MFPHDFPDPIAVGSESDIMALPTTTNAVLVKHLCDSTARALSRFESLRVLYTDGNNAGVTDRTIELLSTLHDLEVLDLESATITDAGLSHLGQLARLRWLDLSLCHGFSEVGLETLRTALPGCEIAL